eukprot:TRINITY_DN59240_c0_g1_i1.p1 TRINITY_DN59240_c0_g1~~TRINITY_DN59240_c0_g1_i1.p1  ORF type:complete len:411 (+),score=74.57 TRINITY_DN59240_c0_g1_i1:237-1469(+)
MQTAKIPVTLLTGFLGSGKTARLNATLQSGEQRVAVIENEIGAIGVDGGLVANRHDDGVIELVNGCLCCSAEVDLVAALEALARRRETRPFDRVIIETTGLADVGPVVALLRDQDDPLAADFTFDGTLTVVDACNFSRWANARQQCLTDSGHDGAAQSPVAMHSTGFGVPAGLAASENAFISVGPGRQAAAQSFWRQIANADRIVISKADLVDGDVLGEVQSELTAVNPMAEIVVDDAAKEQGSQSDRSPIPLLHAGGDLFSSASASRKRPAASLTSKDGNAGVKALKLSGSYSRGRGLAHLDGIQSVAIPLEAGSQLDESAFRELVGGLLSGENSEGLGEVWRAKGVVDLRGQGLCLVQGVCDCLEVSQAPELAGLPRVLVVIGTCLSQERISKRLRSCRVSPTLQLTE